MQPCSDFSAASRAPSHDEGASPRSRRQRLWRRISEEIDTVIRRVCCLQNGWSATHRGGAPAVGGSKVQALGLRVLAVGGGGLHQDVLKQQYYAVAVLCV